MHRPRRLLIEAVIVTLVVLLALHFSFRIVIGILILLASLAFCVYTILV